MMPDQPSTLYTPTVTDVERITAIADPVLRNLHITQCYHELANVMFTRTGLNANWCTFATWASKQAGQTIRKEDILRTLESGIPSAQTAQDATALQALGSNRTETQIQETVAELLNPLGAFSRASIAVGRGNKKVYEEIGREFARFYATCFHDTLYSAANIDIFCEGLRSGEPPEGQAFLRHAFTCYYRALFEPDAKARAELMLFANIQIGFHEQIRLQPEITEAMNAAFIDRHQFRLRLIKALFPYKGIFTRIRLFLLNLFDRPSLLDNVLNRLADEAQQRMHLIITHHVMSISLPDGMRLPLGQDLAASYPPMLQHVELPDLCALLEKVDPIPNAPLGSAAKDWSRLSDRLHFIAEMFRCFHEREDLFTPPFSAAQVTALKANRMPEGQL